MSPLDRLRAALGLGPPPELEGLLAEGEEVLGTARTESGGHLAVTPLGLWVPESAGPRRIGWHVISKATWGDGVLAVTEAERLEDTGDAEVLADHAPVRWRLAAPGKLPRMVRQRVESSIRGRHRKELASGGAWFVLRKVPGRDGVVLQVRPDPGTDREAAAAMAHEAAERMAPPER